jgi:hypothetical protein
MRSFIITNKKVVMYFPKRQKNEKSTNDRINGFRHYYNSEIYQLVPLFVRQSLNYATMENARNLSVQSRHQSQRQA